MMDAVGYSKTSVYVYQIYTPIPVYKTVTFTLTAVRTSKPTNFILNLSFCQWLLHCFSSQRVCTS